MSLFGKKERSEDLHSLASSLLLVLFNLFVFCAVKNSFNDAQIYLLLQTILDLQRWRGTGVCVSSKSNLIQPFLKHAGLNRLHNVCPVKPLNGFLYACQSKMSTRRKGSQVDSVVDVPPGLDSWLSKEKTDKKMKPVMLCMNNRIPNESLKPIHPFS